MPQLDSATFFSQYIWLVVFYIGFYLLLVQTFLPQMARILKTRAALLKAPTDIQAGTSHTALLAARETTSVTALKASKGALAQGFHSLHTWVRTTHTGLQNAKATQAYRRLLQKNAKLQACVHKDVKTLLPVTLWKGTYTDARVHTFHTKSTLAACVA